MVEVCLFTNSIVNRDELLELILLERTQLSLLELRSTSIELRTAKADPLFPPINARDRWNSLGIKDSSVYLFLLSEHV